VTNKKNSTFLSQQTVVTDLTLWSFTRVKILDAALVGAALFAGIVLDETLHGIF